MKVRAQIAMVLNLDKCIGCHTCSITCKNVWTNREGVEYAWFNNVETKPGIGYPKDWENQKRWKGGWIRKKNGSIQPRQGSKWRILSKIFANPHLPEIDDFYEPYTFEYEWLQAAPELQAQPTARPRSLLTGEALNKIEWSGNWEDMLGGEFASRGRDSNFDGIEKEIYGQFEQTFMMYLPRLCEHCLNPACLASCPSGAIYKRAEDGIVLIDQEKCRGWRMCVSGCPYKKIYYNWSTGKSEKCIFCYPRIETGQPTVCSETCVGRIRYLGVVLYDADRIEAAASVEDPQDLYEAQLGVFLDPNDLAVQEAARRDGVPELWLEAATRSPELPDFVPVFLEYASNLPPGEARDFLGQPAHVFAALAERLDERQAPYAGIFHALLALAGVKPDAGALAELKERQPSEDPAKIDEEWEEAPVSFMASAAHDMGGPTGVVAKIRASNRAQKRETGA